jgi:exosortase/archaeosortase family protein
MFRHGFTFELPVIGIQVAQECSSIHSGWALFITGLLVGHVFLKFSWSKFCLSLLTIPIAIFTNAIRIFSIWWLSVHVDIGFMYGILHHRGGIVFSLISLPILLSFVVLLRRVERFSAGRRLAAFSC